MPYQTSIQNQATIRFGSAKIEYGTSLASMTDLGIASNIDFSESLSEVSIKPDNAPEIQVGIKDHKASLKFDLFEFNLTNLAALRGGIDTASSATTTPVAITNESHTMVGTKGQRLLYKNGAGTEVASITVKDSGNTSCVRNTDFVIYQDTDGYTCIARVSNSSVITDGEAITVNYTYTPYASKTITSGGPTAVTANIVRLTNTNAAGKVFQITVYKAMNSKGISLKLPSDEGGDPLKTSIELTGYIDLTRSSGDQLFKIYDEQGA